MCGSTVSTRADSCEDRWQKAGLCRPRAALAALHKADVWREQQPFLLPPQHQDYFHVAAVHLGTQEQPGRVGTPVESSFKLPQHKAAQEQGGIFRLHCLQGNLFTWREEKMWRREEWNLAGKQCREPDGNSTMLGQRYLSPGRFQG